MDTSEVTTDLMDSPTEFASGSEFLPAEMVAVAITDEKQQKAWQLAVIDSVLPHGKLIVCFFVPVPGRMGEKRVAFNSPEDEIPCEIEASSVLPIPPIVTQQPLHGKLVSIVNNHEELDDCLDAVLV